jgi:uncharacterized protein YjbI with pentapeptide repeats
MIEVVEHRGVTWQGRDLSGQSLLSLRFFDSLIEDCTFDGAKLQDLRMWGTTIRRCSFRKTDLRGSALGSVDGAKRNVLEDLSFIETDLRGTVYQSADITRCTFVRCKLKKVDFQGSVFTHCTFEGDLDEVLFYRHGFRGEAFPPNEMRGVDFSNALFTNVEFRKLDMADVRWPTEEDHLVVTDYVANLERAIAELDTFSGDAARRTRAILAHKLKWAGPAQQTGVIRLRDLRSLASPEVMDRLLELWRPH